MTVGIGMISGGGTHILLCADALMTFVAGNVPISTNTRSSKLYRLEKDFCAAVADDSVQAHTLVSHLDNQLALMDQDDPTLPDRVKGAAENSIDYVFTWMRSELLRASGITEAEYLHDAKLLPQKRKEIDAKIKKMDIPVQMIVGGFAKHSPIMLLIQNKRVTEQNDYVAIGSGAELALHWLNLRTHDAHLQVQHAYYHMREAKKFAELDPYVGSHSAEVLLTYRYREMLTPSAANQPGFAQRWWNKCGIGDSSLLDSEEARKEFERDFGVNLLATPLKPQP